MMKKYGLLLAGSNYIAALFIFSDDIDWVKEHIYLEDSHTYITCNRDKNNFEDMRLMSCCKHHIIANSSFSWWGAWLSKERETINIAPYKWFNPEAVNLIFMILFLLPGK